MVGATILIASGADGIRKIDATGESLNLVSFLLYPGLEAIASIATPQALDSALAETNAAFRAKDDLKLIALSKSMARLGFDREHIQNGVYSLLGKDGFQYAGYGGLKVIKTTDDKDPNKPLQVVKVKNLSEGLSPEFHHPS